LTFTEQMLIKEDIITEPKYRLLINMQNNKPLIMYSAETILSETEKLAAT